MLSDDEPTIKRFPWLDWPSCDPNMLTKKLKNREAVTAVYHCKRLDCPNCGPMIATFRAKNLLYKLRQEERVTVWFGEVNCLGVLRAINEYARRHDEMKRIVTVYQDDPDLRTILTTNNAAPRRKGLLVELPIEEAVRNYWWRYAMDHGLRKSPTDDWNASEYGKIDWVDTGPTWDIVGADERMDRIHGYVPGETIEDPEQYKRRFRRIRSSLTNPPAPDLPDDYLSS